MPHYRKLVGEKCYLSPPAPEDAEIWAAWENDLEVTIPLGDEAYTPSSPERTREMITDAVKRGEHVFTIIDLATEQAIGRGMLFSVDLVNRGAMLGIVIGEKDVLGQRLRHRCDAAAAGVCVHPVEPEQRDARRLRVQRAGHCAATAASASGRSAGAGRPRIIGGQKHDAILMDILAEEFESRRSLP